MNNEPNQITAADLVIKVDTSGLTATLALLEQIKIAGQEATAAVASIGLHATVTAEIESIRLTLSSIEASTRRSAQLLDGATCGGAVIGQPLA